MVCHIFRAYTTLLLPDYTSELIDTGIQHAGFEVAVSPQLTQEDYQLLNQVMLEKEKSHFEKAYHLKGQNYQLIDAIQSDSEQLSKLEKDLIVPQALLAMMSQQDTQQQQMAQTLMQRMSPERWRPILAKKLDKVNDQILRDSAMNYTVKTFKNAGGDIGKYQFAYLTHQGLIMLLITAGSVLIAMGAHYLSARVGADVGYQLRQSTFSKVLAFSQEELNHFSTASLITRATNDIQQIQMMLTIILRLTLFAPAMALGGIYHVIKTGTNLSWIILFAVITVIAVVSGLMLISMPKFKLLQKQVDKLNLIAREILTGLQVIRGFNRQRVEDQRFKLSNEDLMQTQLFVNRVMSFMMPLMMLIMNIVTILIVWYAGKEISLGQLQVGQMTAFIQYAMQIIFSFLLFSMMAVMMPRAMVSADRIQEVLDTPLLIHSPDTKKTIQQSQGVISFENVSYQFKGAKTPAVEEITFKAHPGQTTAIIGSTGSGKSTILNLILRFYDVSQGRITIDGVDIRDLDLHFLRDIIGYVPQKGVLFSGTIESNIKYANQAIEDSQMEQAAQIAMAEDFILEKPEAYQAPIAQGGGNVSGGQKQRLAISRAIASDPLIYMFDDSFSALDYRTDAGVRKALAQVTQNKTVLIVAQRVSTILHADNIIVLNEGQVVGQGTHSDLYQHNQVYREIAQSQLSQKEIENSLKTINKGGVHHG